MNTNKYIYSKYNTNILLCNLYVSHQSDKCHTHETMYHKSINPAHCTQHGNYMTYLELYWGEITQKLWKAPWFSEHHRGHHNINNNGVKVLQQDTFILGCFSSLQQADAELCQPQLC